MEQELIKLLDDSLECLDCRLKNDKVIIEVKSVRKQVVCPYCGSISVTDFLSCHLTDYTR